MINSLLSSGHIIALGFIFSDLENNNDFQAAAIRVNKIANSIESIAVWHYLKLTCHLLAKQDLTERQIGKISLKLLLNDIK
tara:strand:- start:269 stop:511 length:243 start_codon:yes stop_codon:yes gene_type:complete